MFDRSAVDPHQVENITVFDFLPTPKNQMQQQSALRAGISDVLSKYYPDSLSQLRKDGRRLEGYSSNTIYQIPVGKTRIFTFPLQHLNEAKIDDISEVLHVFTEYLGYSRDDVRGKKIMFKGDQLTVKNMRYIYPLTIANICRAAIGLQSESLEEFYFDYVEPSAGLFHLQMSVLGMLLNAHFGDEKEVSSVSQYMKLLGRNSNIFAGKSTKKIKNFRACHELFNDILDGYLVAAVAEHYGAKSCADLHQHLEEKDWRGAIMEVEKRFSDPGLVAKWRKQEVRDIAHENVVLFIQHGLMYRDFTNSMRTGDSGRVLHCLKFFTIWFQGSRSSNYSLETIYLSSCLSAIWSEELGKFYLDHCLLNLSGSRKGFQLEDLVCELLVREQKGLGSLINQPAYNKWHQKVVSPIIFKLRDTREAMLKQSGATNYYKHCSAVASFHDVRKVANHALEHRVFIQIPGRCGIIGMNVVGDKTVQPVPDLQMRGIAILSDGKRLENYKQKMRTGIYSPDSEEVNFVGDDSEDEEVEDENENENEDDDYGMFEL
jgi:hypothetical protein